MLADDVAGRTQAEEFEECGISVEDLARGIAAADAIRSVRDQRAEVRFGAAEILLSGAQGGV